MTMKWSLKASVCCGNVQKYADHFCIQYLCDNVSNYSGHIPCCFESLYSCSHTTSWSEMIEKWLEMIEKW